MNKKVEKEADTSNATETKLLTCPVRGELSASALARDGVTPTEESRRVDCIHFLLSRGYPKENIAIETVVIKNLGAAGKNKLRADIIVYDCPRAEIETLPTEEKLTKALQVAEIKRDSKSSRSGIDNQLKPALAQLPRMDTIGVYWDDLNRLIYTKSLENIDGVEQIAISEDDIANLPQFGQEYAVKPITVDKLAPPTNLVGMLFGLANIMRSHGINDEALRYKETVKLILARYCDEREARSSPEGMLNLQVYAGDDRNFMRRVSQVYKIASRRYSRAETLFTPKPESELPERTLREIVKHVQGVDFTAASNETMQQVFMSFIPNVFKKALDQYFTPLGLIETMVSLCNIGPNDNIMDPAMGTADFLTAAMDYRASCGDDDIIQRVFGADCDQKAFDLAVVNMILNRDGQSNLECIDSIEKHSRWRGQINVALCNPPFGAQSVERRASVLKHYDLGHQWEQDPDGNWLKGSSLLPKQQLGILFIERCFKSLSVGGRMAIILPEGYLCTSSYGYVRQWILENTRVLALIELPRRVFAKSDADLRGNIVVLQRLPDDDLRLLRESDYPIFSDMVRKVGFKMGAGFAPTILRDAKTGLEMRDERNSPIIESDFDGVQERFEKFAEREKLFSDPPGRSRNSQTWVGAKVSNVMDHPDLDMKPRRLTARALGNIHTIKSKKCVRLGDIADVLGDTSDLAADPSKHWRLVEGIDIRAIEGLVTPQFPVPA